jgi:hypothetical protein
MAWLHRLDDRARLTPSSWLASSRTAATRWPQVIRVTVSVAVGSVFPTPHERAASRYRAHRSATIIVVAFVGTEGMSGKIEASTTRRPVRPRTEP